MQYHRIKQNFIVKVILRVTKTVLRTFRERFLFINCKELDIYVESMLRIAVTRFLLRKQLSFLYVSWKELDMDPFYVKSMTMTVTCFLLCDQLTFFDLVWKNLILIFGLLHLLDWVHSNCSFLLVSGLSVCLSIFEYAREHLLVFFWNFA